MNAKSVPSSWLERDGRRLDCNPYMSGAIEARGQLGKLPTEALGTLTSGPYGGIFRPPIFGMTFAQHTVESREYGVPFLTSSSMLDADLAFLPLVSRKLATSPKFAVLRIKRGMSLISCSGTVGRVAFARRTMDGMWSSQAVMKIAPDQNRILPGYLFAFLSSRFGVPLIAGGTYGAIVPQIEREHLVSLPVPRIGSRAEAEIHHLIDEAAELRDEASELFAKANSLLMELLSLPQPKAPNEYAAPSISESTPAELVKRADAYYYAPMNMHARRAFDSAGPSAMVGEVAEVFIPGIFKRRYASDPSFGVPYITGADVFRLVPATDQYLLKHLAEDLGLVLRKGTIVIQEAGQLGGLIGRSVLVGDNLDGYACSNNMVRVTARDSADTGYLYAVLASTYGMRLISREAAGSSIPHIEAGRVRGISIPWPERTARTRVGKLVLDAQCGRDDALHAERKAVRLVEDAIQNWAKN